MSINKTLARLNDLVDWFLPPEIAADREVRKQARMFLYSHLFGPFIGNTVPLAFYLLSPKPGADVAILAASISAFWIYPFVLRATGRYNVLTVVSVENLIFSILWSCYFHGGVISPTLPWTLTIPLLAFFYIGPSARMRTIILSQLAINLVIFYYLYQNTSPPSGGMSAAATQALGLVSTIAASLYVTMMALFYANALASQVELEGEMRQHQITASALRQATEDAKRASAAKSEFVAKMSHELRTPLNAVIGYSEMLLEDAIDGRDDSVVSDLKRIHEAGHHLLKLVNEVLDLSKIDAGKMEVFNEFADCGSLLQKAAQTYRRAAQNAEIELRVEAEAKIGVIYSDVMKLNQTIGELLDNAIKHTRGGTITLAASRARRPQGDEIAISVRDTGPGIAKERFESLFEQFSAAGDVSSTKYGGANLGLSLSKKLCNLLQGDITVESELGKGSCFTIRIPASAGAGPAEDDAQDEEVAAALAVAEARSRDMLAVLTVAGSGASARTSDSSIEKVAANV
jgi:signal transduction histidine kinase